MALADLATRAFVRVRRSWDARSFERVVNGLLHTSPLRLYGDEPLFLSMVSHRDVLIYLLAIKSLYVRVGRGQIAIINDGSLMTEDLRLLEHHIPDLSVLHITEISTGICPRGGCWERLAKIIELSQKRYVIQVDSDTLTTDSTPEVIECLSSNRSFLLGTGSGQGIAPVSATARMVRRWIEENGWTEISVGTEAEAALDRLLNAEERSYVHASAGFAGFARGVFSMDDLERFSTQMALNMGAHRWQQWGTEQIASNYLLANAPRARVLPFPRYACFEPHLQLGEHALLHFLGAYRYDRGVYKRMAGSFIASYDGLSASYGSAASSGTS